MSAPTHALTQEAVKNATKQLGCSLNLRRVSTAELSVPPQHSRLPQIPSTNSATLPTCPGALPPANKVLRQRCHPITMLHLTPAQVSHQPTLRAARAQMRRQFKLPLPPAQRLCHQPHDDSHGVLRQEGLLDLLHVQGLRRRAVAVCRDGHGQEGHHLHCRMQGGACKQRQAAVFVGHMYHSAVCRDGHGQPCHQLQCTAQGLCSSARCGGSISVTQVWPALRLAVHPWEHSAAEWKDPAALTSKCWPGSTQQAAAGGNVQL